MKFTRRLTVDGKDPMEGIAFEQRVAQVVNRDGKPIGDPIPVTCPASWSTIASDMLATKYFRRAGVPNLAIIRQEAGIPEWLLPSQPAPNTTFGSETDARQVFHRLAGAWTYWGWKGGYFGKLNVTSSDEEMCESAQAFYDEITRAIADQMVAPNSPQFFNQGLHWAYGITGDKQGHWHFDADGTLRESADAYSRPVCSACFLQPIEDTLLGEGGIVSFVEREARVFKGGSGSGANVSKLRGRGEPLSGGGTSSGLMSWLPIFDANAAGIKSGGTTRRAARALILDDDHPDLEAYIGWKRQEEFKVASLIAGSTVIRRHAAALRRAASIPLSAELRAAKAAARRDGVPTNLIADVIRLAEAGSPEEDFEQFVSDYTGEAYQTVSGQNANNSVSVTNSFMIAAENNVGWTLRSRTGKMPDVEVPARKIWDGIVRSAWSCADPGLYFQDTINDWNTCAADGRIHTANPCFEALFLDDTACSLACLNLMKFYSPSTQRFDDETFRHVARIFTTVLDISVGTSQYPSKGLANGSYQYRTIGLGFCNIGALLMANGLPYDSDDGRTMAAAVAAIMHFEAYRTSAEMVQQIGTFPRYAANRSHLERVVWNHAVAAGAKNDFIDLSILPPCHLREVEQDRPEEIVRLTMVAVVGASEALDRVKECGTRNAQVTVVMPAGTVGLLMDADTTGVEPDFAMVKHKKLVGGGYLKIVNQTVPAALRRLCYSEEDVQDIVKTILLTGTVEGSRLLHDHLPVFDCANRCGPRSTRSIAPAAHVRMVAAIQPFISGGISKTANLPNDATEADVAEVFRLSWQLGVKAIPVYRDGSKLSQPLSSGDDEPDEELPMKRTLPVESPAPVRRPLPDRRKGYTQKARIGSNKLYIRTGEYEDGSLGEIFLDMHKEGAAFRSMVSAFAIAVSLGLQHGTPLEEFVEAFSHTKFEPNGPVRGNDRIKNCSSLMDYIFRELAITYLGRDDLAHTPRPTDEAVHVLNGKAESAWSRVAPLVATKAQEARDQGYEGDPCSSCGNFLLVRSGTCCVCKGCGSSSGCS